MTLTEFAHELSKVIKFDYLTVHKNFLTIDVVCLWDGKPEFGKDRWEAKGTTFQITCFYTFYTQNKLDLSEYKDNDRNMDFSKCIVEVDK